MSKIINILNQDGQLVVTSRQVAGDFEKEHFHVLRDIENLIGGISKNGDTYNHLFIETQQMLEEAVKHFGTDDIITKMLSIKRDKEIVEEQKEIYKNYKGVQA